MQGQWSDAQGVLQTRLRRVNIFVTIVLYTHYYLFMLSRC